MKIPVVVVDDNKTDRYMIKRRLSQVDEFELIDELAAGDTLVADYFAHPRKSMPGDRPLLILLDINMPRMNGFQAVAEIEKHVAQAPRPDNCVIMMCTTSQSPEDTTEAKRHSLIQGYFVKPISAQDVDEMRRLYHQHHRSLPHGQVHG